MESSPTGEERPDSSLPSSGRSAWGDIVAKYEGHFATQYLLPIITDLRADERIQYKNALCRVNIALKGIARLVGLALPLSMYCARHAWASIAKS